MADEATLRSRLTEAEDALHDLMTSQTIVEVDYQGHKTQFSRANEGALRRYIRELKCQLGEITKPRSRRVLF